MMGFIPFKNSKIHFADEGKGPVVLFLHGYLESLDIWKGFYERLLPHYRVIRMDIPGHGQSGVVAETHSMDMMAEAVGAVLKALDVENCVLTGHSMGGYVAMACMAHYPRRIAGVCLFHSSPLADNRAKRTSRNKEIRLVNEGKMSLICHFSIPNGFAEENLSEMAEKIAFARDIALTTPTDGVIAILKGMRDRPDRQELLRRSKLPLLFIVGRYDSLVLYEEVQPVAASIPNAQIEVLEHSGHSGYLEEPERAAELLSAFLRKCFAEKQS